MEKPPTKSAAWTAASRRAPEAVPSRSSSMESPVTNPTYPGTIGKTHGERKETIPGQECDPDSDGYAVHQRCSSGGRPEADGRTAVGVADGRSARNVYDMIGWLT
jgi:hypothetical protein